MNKYLTVFKTGFKQEKDAVFDNIVRSIIFCIIMYILVQLWSFIYGDNGTSAVINGYSLNQMIWYLIIGECIVNSARTSSITREITNEIKTGSIAYKLNKPYNYYLYSISSFMAKSFFMMLFTIPTAVLIGVIFVGVPDSFTWTQIIPCLIVFLMSILLNWCIFGVVGILAFWVQDSTPYYWIVSKLFMLCDSSI